MYTKKKLPKTQYELSKGAKNLEFERANDVRRDNDNLKDLLFTAPAHRTFTA